MGQQRRRRYAKKNAMRDLKRKLLRELAETNLKLWRFLNEHRLHANYDIWAGVAENPYFVFLAHSGQMMRPNSMGARNWLDRDSIDTRIKEADRFFMRVVERHEIKQTQAEVPPQRRTKPRAMAVYSGDDRLGYKKVTGTIYSFPDDEVSAAVEFKLRFYE